MFMNIEIKKKFYTAPTMLVVEMRGPIVLQSGSTAGAPEEEDGVLDYNGELGFIFKDSDRKA